MRRVKLFLGCAAMLLASAVQARASVVLADNFDPGVDPGSFSSIIGGSATGAGELGFLDGNALWFGDIPGDRSATTAALNLAQGGTVSFAFRGGNELVDGITRWENSETSTEWVDLAYSIDGVNFVNFYELNTEANIGQDPSVWNSISVVIPDAAESASTQFRWTQRFNNGPSTDHWAIDNLVVAGVPEPSSLALLGLGTLGAGVNAARRRRNSKKTS